MYGIYVYENGLHFTGKIAKTEEEARNYLAQTHGKMREVCIGRDNNGYPIYEERFVPSYNKEAFEIKKLEIV